MQDRQMLPVRLHKALKHLQLKRGMTGQDLAHLLASLFQLRDKVLGLADKQGKVYDLQWVARNYRLLPRAEPLVVLAQARDSTESVLSFGTEKSRKSLFSQPPLEHQSTPNPLLESGQELQAQSLQHHQRGQEAIALGLITDLPSFEGWFLEQQGVMVVFCVKSLSSLNQVKGVRFFYMIGEGKQLACIYCGRKRMIQIPLEAWPLSEARVRRLQWGPHCTGEEEQKSNYSFDPSRPFFLQYLQKMYDTNDLTQAQFLSLKCRALQSPLEFYREYNLHQRIEYQEFATLVVGRLEQTRGGNWLRSRGLVSRQGRAFIKDDFHKETFVNEIPIIVRRNGNVIQKISTDWPLNLEQEKYIQVINELELKGLLEDMHSRTVRTMIFEQSLQVGRLLNAFLSEQLEQTQLARALRQIVEKRKQRAFTPDSPEARSQMLTQVLHKLIKSPKQLQALLILAEKHNESLLAAQEVHLIDGNETLFLSQMRRILNNMRRESDAPEFGLRQISL